jgi:hypothetical protein
LPKLASTPEEPLKTDLTRLGAGPSGRASDNRVVRQGEREVLMPQWKPSLRLLLIVSALLAFAAALGWVDLASFLEW